MSHAYLSIDSEVALVKSPDVHDIEAVDDVTSFKRS